MKDPSPKAHLFRLGILVGAFIVLFLTFKTLATPSSWNFEDWYRGESLNEMLKQPLIYGGNESCKLCHQEELDELLEFKHKTLSCESCHGPLADHVKDEQKIADAPLAFGLPERPEEIVDATEWQCLNCHDEQVAKPEGFPQFNKKSVEEHGEIEEGMVCMTCHTPHDPSP